MSKIPFVFETPVPKYFRETGWFKNQNTMIFVTWAFSKCSTIPRKVIMDGREITLAPYEFIAGRRSGSAECFLTEDAFRYQLNRLLKSGLLKKTPNSSMNRFTCYIWSTECFTKTQKNICPPLYTPLYAPLNVGLESTVEPITDTLPHTLPPTLHPQSKNKNIRNKQDHHPYPSSKKAADRDADPQKLTDDFYLIKKEKAQDKVQVVEGVYLTQTELNQCITIKGSLESVQQSMKHILSHPARKTNIRNWVNALSVWNIKTDITPKLIEHEKIAIGLEKQFHLKMGWICEIHKDPIKDQKGLLFYNSLNSVGNENIFIPYTDPEFKPKTIKTLKEKKMDSQIMC